MAWQCECDSDSVSPHSMLTLSIASFSWGVTWMVMGIPNGAPPCGGAPGPAAPPPAWPAACPAGPGWALFKRSMNAWGFWLITWVDRGGGGWTWRRGEERGGKGRREEEGTENGGQRERSKGVSQASLTSLKRVWERDREYSLIPRISTHVPESGNETESIASSPGSLPMYRSLGTRHSIASSPGSQATCTLYISVMWKILRLTWSSCGLLCPICCSNACSIPGFCCSTVRNIWNWGRLRRNSRGLPVEWVALIKNILVELFIHTLINV